MRKQPDNSFVVILITTILMLGGCSHNDVYEKWRDEINNAPSTNKSIDDISLLLGAPPTKCHDIVPSPTLGATIDSWSEVTGLWFDGPARKAGISEGDRIRKVGGKEVSSGDEANAAFDAIARFDQPVAIETKRGTYIVVPKRPKEAKQCYWEKSKYFRAACQFYDSKALRCSSNWQR